MFNSAAFFDVDETLINIKSMFDFFEFWCHENNQHFKLESYMAHFRAEVKKGASREILNREYYRQFAGVSYQHLEDLAEKWFKLKIESRFFIGSAVSSLKKHQDEKTYTVFVSGSMLPILSPIARYLGVNDILCAPIILDGSGVLTGEIGQPQTIGAGKKSAIINFCNLKKLKLSDCYAYGDDLSDIPMLEATGHPVCVGKYSALAKYAIEKNWPII